jgi:formylglycine-generating enzyme required for sulfatase activity
MNEPRPLPPAAPELVSISGGWFWMGSEAGQSNERPVHRVWVDSFKLAAFVVTNAQFAVFLEATRREAPPAWNHPEFNHPRQPVVSVSWFDATDYCEWLTQMTGQNYRLPTEAEWNGQRGAVSTANSFLGR